jgi:hypothetical protein
VSACHTAVREFREESRMTGNIRTCGRWFIGYPQLTLQSPGIHHQTNKSSDTSRAIIVESDHQVRATQIKIIKISSSTKRINNKYKLNIFNNEYKSLAEVTLSTLRFTNEIARVDLQLCQKSKNASD